MLLLHYMLNYESCYHTDEYAEQNHVESNEDMALAALTTLNTHASESRPEKWYPHVGAGLQATGVFNVHTSRVRARPGLEGAKASPFCRHPDRYFAATHVCRSPISVPFVLNDFLVSTFLLVDRLCVSGLVGLVVNLLLIVLLNVLLVSLLMVSIFKRYGHWC